MRGSVPSPKPETLNPKPESLKADAWLCSRDQTACPYIRQKSRWSKGTELFPLLFLYELFPLLFLHELFPLPFLHYFFVVTFCV